MVSKTFKVPTISCDHCTSTIETEISELEGVVNVKADITSKTVTIEWEEPQTWDGIKTLLHELNYMPQE